MGSEKETLRDDVRVGDIFLDEEYGRLPRTVNIERMASEWDRARVGAIYLSMRPDGRFAVLDGNHRVMACRVVEGDDATLPARIYLDLTLKEEADLFTAFNRDRAQPRPGDVFRARLAAGDKGAIEIKNIVESLGLRLALDGQAADGAINAIAAIEKIYQQYGANGLREVLLTLRNTMGTGASAIQAPVLKALAAFMVRYYAHPHFDKARLYGVLSTHSPAQLKALSRTIQSTSSAIDSGTANGMAILTLYNDKLRKGALPEWRRNASTEEVNERLRPIRAANLTKAPNHQRGAA